MGTASRGYAYEYDRAGNQTKKTETGNGEDKVTEYAYDSLNRLSEVTEDDGTRTEYSFDAWGNIAEKAYYHPDDFVFESGNVSISGVTEHTVSYSYDAANRLLSETESVTGSADFSGVRTYAYDDAGNLTSKTTSGDYGAKSESYAYDAFGKLIKYLEDGEEKASYKYNGNGQRVEKTVNGVKTKFYWDGANIKNEGTANAVNVTNYFGANGVFARKSGLSVNVLYKNGHGDTVLLTSGNTVVRDYEYDAYGKEKGGSSADENPFRYSGEYFDSETGFIYLRNRYYDPSSARFISEDTHWNTKNMISGDDEQELTTDAFDIKNEAKEAKESKTGDKPKSKIFPQVEAIYQSSNLFSYCMGNPVKYYDPEGEVAATLTAVALIVVGGLATTILLVELDKKVGDVLKNRKGSIKNAPKPPGTPGWDAIRDLTMHEILRRAKNGDKGFKTIWKLLVDGRFKK